MRHAAHVLTTTHSDEVSGCTILHDGTKVYWTEGRSSTLIVIANDGTRTELNAGIESPLVDLLNEIAETGNEPQRPMTDAEEAEYAMTR